MLRSLPRTPNIAHVDEGRIDAAAALALRALGWTLGEPARATRMLAVTGLAPADLRARAGEPALLAGVVRFLGAHEADLVACAEALEVAPEALVAAGAVLEG